MIAPATTAMATELFILQKMRPGAPVFQPGRLPQSNSTRPSVWTFDQLECGDVGAFYPRLQRSPAHFTGCVAGVRYQELCFGAFVLGAAIAFDDGRHSRNMRLKPDVFQPETPPPSNSLTTGVWGEVSFGLPGRTGDESISRDPSGVPVLDSFTAHGAFKAADLARFCDVFAAVINRAALASSMDTDHRTSSPPHDPATCWRPTAPRDSPLEGFPGKSASRDSCTRVKKFKLPTQQLFPAIRNFL